MQDYTSTTDSILSDGTYAFQNPFSYVSNTYVVTGVATVEVHTIVVPHYPAELLKVITREAFAALLEVARRWGRITFIPATPEPEPTPVALAEPTYGNKRAEQLHKIMAIVGIPKGEHYAFARAATDDHSIWSLAALTIEQAKAVWAYLCFCFPKAARWAVSA